MSARCQMQTYAAPKTDADYQGILQLQEPHMQGLIRLCTASSARRQSQTARLLQGRGGGTQWRQDSHRRVESSGCHLWELISEGSSDDYTWGYLGRP